MSASKLFRPSIICTLFRVVHFSHSILTLRFSWLMFMVCVKNIERNEMEKKKSTFIVYVREQDITPITIMMTKRTKHSKDKQNNKFQAVYTKKTKTKLNEKIKSEKTHV